MSTTVELGRYVGKTGTVAFELSLRFPVRIKDCRQVFNRVDFLVCPVQGTGERWIMAERVAVDGEAVAA